MGVTLLVPYNRFLPPTEDLPHQLCKRIRKAGLDSGGDDGRGPGVLASEAVIPSPNICERACDRPERLLYNRSHAHATRGEPHGQRQLR